MLPQSEIATDFYVNVKLTCDLMKIIIWVWVSNNNTNVRPPRDTSNAIALGEIPSASGHVARHGWILRCNRILKLHAVVCDSSTVLSQGQRQTNRKNTGEKKRRETLSS
jgi:hypothetical protein